MPHAGTLRRRFSISAWSGFSRDAQHTAQSAVATAPLTRIVWQTSVDLQPQYGGGGQYLLTHYGSPVISSMNTVSRISNLRTRISVSASAR